MRYGGDGSAAFSGQKRAPEHGIAVALMVGMNVHDLNRHHASILPVLYVGPELAPGVIRELWESGIGVLTFSNPVPALRLLHHCRVRAVLYADASRDNVQAFRDLQVPVIVLAAGDQEWSADDVTVLDSRSSPGTFAALIRHALRERGPSAMA